MSSYCKASQKKIHLRNSLKTKSWSLRRRGNQHRLLFAQPLASISLIASCETHKFPATQAARAATTRKARPTANIRAQIHEPPHIPRAMNALDHSFGSWERGAVRILGACRITNQSPNMDPRDPAPQRPFQPV